MVGKTISHYEVLEKVGEGGMGVVYKARDSHLKRFVALKVLPPQMVADAERKQRFVQEARSASALNHPNIITVHDIDQADGVDFIAMEYVEGKTLDELIGRKGLKLNDALKCAIQIADALAKAHAAGIIHRDLKPGNVMVTAEGRVKVLDFGLAKLTEPVSVDGEDSILTEKPSTETGLIVGTVSYMSPEQAEGKKVDFRSDIFSFGSVLYEMLTGRRPFRRDTPALTLAAILHLEPPPLPAEIPQDLSKVVTRCLRKDPARRFQHMADVKVELEEVKEESDPTKLAGIPAAERKRPRRWRWAVAAAAALIVVALGAGLWLVRRASMPPPRLVPLTDFAGSELFPSFSPDGTQVAFQWNGEKQDNWDIYVMMVGSATALRLTSDPAEDGAPAWSPDGRQIAFLSRRGQVGIYLVSSLGGPNRKLVDLPEMSYSPPSWSPDGRFLAVARSYDEKSDDPNNGAVLLIPVEGGGEPRRILTPQPGRWYAQPAFSPDGRQLAAASCTGAYQSGGGRCQHEVLALSADLFPQGKARAINLAGGQTNGIAWTEDGDSLLASYVQHVSPIFRIPVRRPGERQRLEVAGDDAGWPAVDAKGHRLAFSRSRGRSYLWRWERDGKPSALAASSWWNTSPQFSHDGRRIAFTSGIRGVHVWVANADGTGSTQVTMGERMEGAPRWSPDDRWIAYDAEDKNGRWEVRVVEASGGPARALTRGPGDSAVPSWSADGKWVYFYSNRSGRLEIWRVPSQGGTAEQVTRKGGYVAFESTDAKTLYYTKSESGAEGLFAMPPAGGEERQVTNERVAYRGFAVFPDGIYYITGQDPNYEVRFHEFASGRSQKVFAVDGPLSNGLSVSPDRRAFLLTKVTSEADLMMVENFR